MPAAGAVRAAIVGIAGPVLAAAEVALFRARPPRGVILFRRNIETAAQLTQLTGNLRDLLGAEAALLIDQEGGRVARLRQPHFTEFPPAASFEDGPEAAAEANAALMAMQSVALGLDVLCAPVLDLRLPGADAVIGDRAFAADPAEVARLGGAWIAGLHSAGAIPVIKHIPGHGRATADSHRELPRVTASRAELEADFAPFRALARSGAWAMTAHILYTALDADRPATLSRLVIERSIRGAIGFDGVLISDDLAMGALAGAANDLGEAALAAGCDLLLHCTGRIEDTAALLAGCPPPTDRALARLAAARAARDHARRPAHAA